MHRPTMLEPALKPDESAASHRGLSAASQHCRAMNPSQTYPAAAATAQTKWWARRMLNKVPEITLYFWVIKILCTTVGETFADNLNENLGLGLTNTTYIMGALPDRGPGRPVPLAPLRPRHLLAGGGADQRRRHPGQRQPGRKLRRRAGDDDDRLRRDPDLSSSPVWYWSERTLSVHTIVTTRREAFYWLAILFTFALGTSAGDLLSEKLELGYLPRSGSSPGRSRWSRSSTSR